MGALAPKEIEGMDEAGRAEAIEGFVEIEQGLARLLSILGADGRVGARTEVSAGAGLGGSLSPEAADERLERITQFVPVESWAGEVARPTEFIERIGVARSTLDSWRQEGIAVGLPRGRRAHVYPLEQFREGRPLPELDAVVRAAGGDHARLALAPDAACRLQGQAPLNALKRGATDAVADAAARCLLTRRTIRRA